VNKNRIITTKIPNEAPTTTAISRMSEERLGFSTVIVRWFRWVGLNVKGIALEEYDYAMASLLRFEVFGVLNCADLYVGVLAIFVEAEACDPYFTVAEHNSLRVDEESVIFLLEDDVGDVMGNDAVVVLDEGLRGFDGQGTFAGVDLDGIVDQGCDGGGIVLGDGLLKVSEELVNFDVASDGEVDGFVEVGSGSLCDPGDGQKKGAGA
jgi:hypothetical protein